jgi:hypothetical protein
VFKAFLIGCALAIVVLPVLGDASTFTYLLNGKKYPVKVAPPYRKLSSVAQIVYPELFRIPGTNDVLGYEIRGISVTGRVEQARLLVCSNGLEMNISTQTIREVFQSLAEMDIMLHSPQQPLRDQVTIEDPHKGRIMVEQRSIQISPLEEGDLWRIPVPGQPNQKPNGSEP